MPIATPDVYRAMLDAARDGGYALPAINVTGSETLNAALDGFAQAESDGIVQAGTADLEQRQRVAPRRPGRLVSPELVLHPDARQGPPALGNGGTRRPPMVQSALSGRVGVNKKTGRRGSDARVQ